MTIMTNRTNGWKLIGRSGDDYYFVDSIFQHRDDFSGVTGSIIRPVSPDEHEWATSRDNVAERLEDYWREMKGCACGHDYSDDADFNAWVDEVIRVDGAEHVVFDESDGCDASDSFDELGIEHECTDCSGGGRIFSRCNGNSFDEVFDRKALVAVMAYEDGAVSRDYAECIIFGK